MIRRLIRSGDRSIAFLRVNAAGTILASRGIVSVNQPATGQFDVTLRRSRAINRRHVNAVSTAPNPTFVSVDEGASTSSVIVVRTWNGNAVAADRAFKMEVTRQR